MSKQFLILFALCHALMLGCTSGPFAKRDQEYCCPTDIRQKIPMTAGEDAVFACPCGPDASYHGYKPTCWRGWPASTEEWRQNYCGQCFSGDYNPLPTQPVFPAPEFIQPQQPATEAIPPQTNMKETSNTHAMAMQSLTIPDSKIVPLPSTTVPVPIQQPEPQVLTASHEAPSIEAPKPLPPTVKPVVEASPEMPAAQASSGPTYIPIVQVKPSNPFESNSYR